MIGNIKVSITRVTNTSATIIDHIWSTHVENNISNFIIHTNISSARNAGPHGVCGSRDTEA